MGRWSAYKELAEARGLQEVWDRQYPKEYVRFLEEKDSLSPKELFLMKLLQGNEKFLLEVFQKVYPTKIQAEVTEEITLTQVQERILQRAISYVQPHDTLAAPEGPGE